MTAPVQVTAAAPHGPAALRGMIDDATPERVSGWAQDPAFPDRRVALLVTADDVLLARVLADRPRDDLRQAGLGDGRHGFELNLKGLSPVARHVIAVRRESDGMHLEGSPAVLEPAAAFDRAFQAHCRALLAAPTDADGVDERLAFLAEQAETLLRQRAQGRSRHADRAALRQIKWRWRAAEPPALPRRALFVDEAVPVPTRDAGSNAALSHMHALIRLGFEVHFAAADMAPDAAGVLESSGIACCHAPWHGSVEEVLRREADSFDVVYLHRASVAARYIGLVRFHQPRARLIYSVADLHHLRLARQADAEQREEVAKLARQFRLMELRAAAAADAVITHSTYEAALLRQQIKGARVHVVPWSIPVRPTHVPFDARRGAAFFGNYGHMPNRDAARWLITDIMPAVRRTHPAITCLLAGSDMPDVLRRGAEGIEVTGHVRALSDLFDRVRLTVAPMAYGAGIKGKVLESLAAGVPCVCTPVAAEGLELPELLRSLVAADTEALAALIVRLHEDAAFNRACREAALAYVGSALSRQRIDALMEEVTGGRAGPAEQAEQSA
jgi:glycosyltransferase involved in cell wall biosynthesis